MSEPVSNAEIEDVLSSIRRLVSNDVEAFQAKAVAEPAKAEPAAKLILTADFRVAAPRNQETDSTETVISTDSDIASLGIDKTSIDEAVEEIVEEPIMFQHTEQTSNAAAHPEGAFVAGPAEDLPQEITDIEAQYDAAGAAAIADAAPAAASLEGTIADLEAAIAAQNGEWEPDGSSFEEDADAEEVMLEPIQDWIDGTAKDLDAVAEVAETDATGDDDPDLFGAQESVIDEETLRDMVSDIVRQELQGALGERITRNVRKLVRREINRVLAAQDFD